MKDFFKIQNCQGACKFDINSWICKHNGPFFLTPIEARGNEGGKEVGYNSIFEYLGGSYLYI